MQKEPFLHMLHLYGMQTIPRTIHYFWFGKKEKTELIKRCIASWREKSPELIISEWNEENFDISAHPFTKRMYEENKFAFVADYARLAILEQYGGIYLDTDMELVKDITPLLATELLLGEEEPGVISAGMIGTIPHHQYITACKKIYDTLLQPETIPRVMTEIYKKQKETLLNTTICPPAFFYPYSQETISRYGKEPLPQETFGVHLWNYSWGHPLNRFFKKIGIYYYGKKITEVLGIKKIIKKILGFI